MPFLAEYNYGITDESTLEVLRNVPSLIDSAEHENAAACKEAELFINGEVSPTSLLAVPSFEAVFEFDEPLGTSTQFSQDPLKVENSEVASPGKTITNQAEQTSTTAHDAIEAWMEANCADPPAISVLFAPPAELEPASGTPESDPIIFGAKQRTPPKVSETLKPAANQKPWKKFEFTDTDDVSPPLSLPSSSEDKIVEVVESVTEVKNVPEKISSQTAKQPKKPQYSAEFQKILDNAIAKRKDARKANRQLKLPVVQDEKESTQKKKITWRDFAHLFPESDEENASPSKKQQPSEIKKSDLIEAPMEVELNKAALCSHTSPEKAVAIEEPKKISWRDFYMADSD